VDAQHRLCGAISQALVKDSFIKKQKNFPVLETLYRTTDLIGCPVRIPRQPTTVGLPTSEKIDRGKLAKRL